MSQIQGRVRSARRRRYVTSSAKFATCASTPICRWRFLFAAIRALRRASSSRSIFCRRLRSAPACHFAATTVCTSLGAAILIFSTGHLCAASSLAGPTACPNAPHSIGWKRLFAIPSRRGLVRSPAAASSSSAAVRASSRRPAGRLPACGAKKPCAPGQIKSAWRAAVPPVPATMQRARRLTRKTRLSRFDPPPWRGT